MSMGKETCLDVASKLVKEALNLGATQAEARILNFKNYLTRFAGSTIHQNVGEGNTNLTLRFVLGKRVSTVSTNDTSLKSIKGLAEKGYKLARILGENPEFVSLPEPEPISELKGLFIRETAECTPDTRAEMIRALIDEANSISPYVKEVAGALSINSFDMAVTNSLGVNAYARSTHATLSATTISGEALVEGYGSAGDVSRNVKELDTSSIGREATERSVKSLGAKTIEPGEYEVVLEPYAVATALRYTGYGLSALPYQDGTSFMNDLMGKKAFSEQFTLWDDGRNLRGLAFPFDFEGIPKKKIMLIEEGTPKAVVYDSYTANKEGKKSTGHALGIRPMPSHLFMEKGDATKEEMIGETKKGLLVTTFHYVRTVHPRKLVITGMTRDGTWFIEDGEIKHPVKNLRFTESLLKTYANIELVGKEVKRRGRGLAGSMLVPALKAKSFLFTGVTQ